MNHIGIQVLRSLPGFTVLFSFWAVYVTLGILSDTKQSCILFATFLLQVYLNWLALLVGNRNCTSYNTQRASYLDYKLENIPIKIRNYRGFLVPYYQGRDKVMNKDNYFEYDFLSSAEVDIQKIWYCPRCCKNSLQNCHHCSLCRRCIVEKDHHCIFLGTCISKNNLQYFVILLLYLFIVSSYITVILWNKMNLSSLPAKELWQHIFPLYFARWLSDHEYTYNLGEKFLLNVTILLALFSIVIAVYYLYRLVEINSVSKELPQTGREPVEPDFTELSLLFFKHGFINLLFPTVLLKYCFPLSFQSNSLKGN